jgi:hypothetical protein
MRLSITMSLFMLEARTAPVELINLVERCEREHNC